LGLAGVVEAVDARMLEKPAQLADDADVLRHALDAGPQAADLADHHVDLHTLVRSTIQCSDHAPIRESVHLNADTAAAAGLCMLDLAVDQRHEAIAHCER